MTGIESNSGSLTASFVAELDVLYPSYILREDWAKVGVKRIIRYSALSHVYQVFAGERLGLKIPRLWFCVYSCTD